MAEFGLVSVLSKITFLEELKCFLLLLYLISGLLKTLKDISIPSSLRSQNYCVPVSFVIFSSLFSAL